jgi:RNA polymerase sigma factor (sigma-70 family)
MNAGAASAAGARSRAPQGDVSGPSDEELMDRYCAGETAAFDELFKRFQGRLVRFLTQMVGPTTAVDVAQITFLKVHENRHRYKTGHNLAAWVFTIARNTALDHIRSAPRRREVTGLEIDPGEDGPRRDLFSDQRVRDAIGALPDDQKQVILLHWFGGLTFEEVSSIVGATSAAVRVRAHRGYEKLLAALGPMQQEAQG